MSLPDARNTQMMVASRTTCSLVTMWPAESQRNREPILTPASFGSPLLAIVEIRTTDGETRSNSVVSERSISLRTSDGSFVRSVDVASNGGVIWRWITTTATNAKTAANKRRVDRATITASQMHRYNNVGVV